MTMITPSYLGETIEYSSLHACRSTLEDPTTLVLLLRDSALEETDKWILAAIIVLYPPIACKFWFGQTERGLPTLPVSAVHP